MKVSIYLVFLFSFLATALLATTPREYRKRISKVVSKDYNQSDTQAEVQFGKTLAATILAKNKLLKDKRLTKYLNRIGAAIVAYMGRPEIKYFFGILDSDDINAYACPGGYIFITKGALKLMKDESQLAGVISHEIAHVNYRHIVKQLKISGKDDSITAGIVSIVGGQAVTIFKFINASLDLLFTKGLQKEDEFEADSYSFEALATLGYDLKSYYGYLTKVKDVLYKYKDQPLSKTHPSMDIRLLKIKKIMSSLTDKTYKGKRFQKRFNRYVKI